MSKENKTVELKDKELESVAGGGKRSFTVEAGWYKPDPTTYYYLDKSFSGLNSQVAISCYSYDSYLNCLIRDSTPCTMYMSKLASFPKVADEDVPPIFGC